MNHVGYMFFAAQLSRRSCIITPSVSYVYKPFRLMKMFAQCHQPVHSRFTMRFISTGTILAVLGSAASVFSAKPSIQAPANGTVIKPGASFDFSYQSIADYGVSSYNYTVWLFTSPPTSVAQLANFATGYYFGRFAEPNYPGGRGVIVPMASLT